MFNAAALVRKNADRVFVAVGSREIVVDTGIQRSMERLISVATDGEIGTISGTADAMTMDAGLRARIDALPEALDGLPTKSEIDELLEALGAGGRSIADILTE